MISCGMLQAWFETEDSNGTAASTAAEGYATTASEDWLASTSVPASLAGGGSSASPGVSFLRPHRSILPGELQPVAEESLAGSTTAESAGIPAAQQPGLAEDLAASEEASMAVSVVSASTSIDSGAGFWQSPGAATASSLPSEVTVSAADAAHAAAAGLAPTGSEDIGMTADSAAAAVHAARSGSTHAAPKQVLFIQMEYCPRTLRQVGGTMHHQICYPGLCCRVLFFVSWHSLSQKLLSHG